MSLSLAPSKLKRYYDIAKLFYKYGRGDLIQDMPEITGYENKSSGETEPTEKAIAFAKDLEARGPTFIKLGQLLSTRSDWIAPEYAKALERLQDDVKTFPWDQVQATLSQELGLRISKAFLEFEQEPLAAASLSQVHRAVTRSGRAVVVKIQRPGVRETVIDDLDALAEVAAFIERKSEVAQKYQPVAIVEELRRSLLRELDYRIEAENLRLMKRTLDGFERVDVPEPLEDYSSGRVLTMELVDGQKITHFSPLVMMDVDGEGLAEDLFRCYLHQVLVTGFFHADPHPGNIFLTGDKKLMLLDLGMVSHLGTRMQEQLIKMLGAIAEGDGDRVAEIAEHMGTTGKDFDKQGFNRRVGLLVAENSGASLSNMETGRLLMEVQKAAAECDLLAPIELSLLGKTLLNLDRVGRALAPAFDPNASIRRNLGDIVQKRLKTSLSPSSLLDVVMETKEVVRKIPARMGQIMDLAAENKLRVKVDTIDENLIITSLQKIANRITLGLIIAALIVGAALLTRVQTSFTLFGYSGLAMTFFLIAVLGAGVLTWQILFRDQPDRQASK